ncbi:MAG: hypothetical protein PHF00_08265 [Elusimicrobia bacterium]|nr:hypothetical protein [Elusimicrobiota bacterium]
MPKTLHDLIDHRDLEAVRSEVLGLCRAMSPDLDPAPVAAAFSDLRELFSGGYPGYRACNTDYHDIYHTTDTLLATVRLMHGAWLQGSRFTNDEIVIAAVSAIFHDSGYIQTADDTRGTGARYTACHVDRSIRFLEGYCRRRRLPAPACAGGASLLRCTGLNVDVAGIVFPPGAFAQLGRMLGAGDLLGQMADRTYLEKLLFLFYEFREGDIPGFSDEFDLLRKTLSFYELTRKRLAEDLGGADRFMRPHFAARWGLDRDLYAEAIARHMDYLRGLVAGRSDDFRRRLRRGGVVEKLDRLFGRPRQ